MNDWNGWKPGGETDTVGDDNSAWKGGAVTNGSTIEATTDPVWAPSRRKLLKALGMAGTAAVLGGLLQQQLIETAYAAGTYSLTTIAGLRAISTAPDPANVYYVTDRGQEGHFYYDSTDTVSADNTGTIVVSTASSPGYRFKRIVETEAYNVKWFGAKGDGTNDDTQAIRNAISAASAAGGGVVFFPQGTFIVSPGGATRIDLKSFVHLNGTGAKSVIKVKNNPGDYATIFGASSAVLTEHVRISNLKFDQNPANNTSCNLDTTRIDTNWYQFCIMLYNYDHITIDNCIFDPVCGVNAVTLNNPACRNATIRNCYFRFVRGTGTTNYDNTSVYLNGRNHTVSDCRFYTDISAKALGAIETHTGQSVIANNVTENFCTGINLQASADSDPHCDMTITGNTFSNANQAIQLWPLGNHPIKNVTITGNTISLDNPGHNRATTAGITSAGSSTDTGAFENINITGNTILFKEELVSRSGTFYEGFAYGIGIAKDTTIRDLIISNNVIKYAPCVGIHIGTPDPTATNCVLENVSVTGNVIINSGCYPALNELMRAGILLRKTVRNAKVSGNCIFDTYNPCRSLFSIRMNASEGTFTNVEVSGNFTRTSQGGLYLDLATTVTNKDAPGAVQVSAANPPNAGSYTAGDIVVTSSAAVTDGQTPAGYKCTVSGTFGSITGITATGASGSFKLTVSGTAPELAKLQVGQWINIVTTTAGMVSRQIMRIGGTDVRLHASLPGAVSGGAVTYAAPVLKPFGAVGAGAAIPNVAVSSFAAVETELNKLKQALRNSNLIAP
ncbi:twin-arginine translocation signal domain-containing protein [Paenibacillus mesophilus]|uniref:glycosyl hydrolase family 28-related protein n=1 Tax=Paenibacillus mesophilus TaxID=2582849 RepID=UPI00110E6C3C|nr:glycosyl hydrolase family 28-related protein [Paenibacillus mesophilus]TMV52145.1 twin-arginine translocation signal domain-containing protein [Paenibacillus mesophilus]